MRTEEHIEAIELAAKDYANWRETFGEAKAWAQLQAAIRAGVGSGEPVHQFRKCHCSDWYDGRADHSDGNGPYEERTLYTAPPQQAVREPLRHEQAKALTPEQIDTCFDGIMPSGSGKSRYDIARSIEAEVRKQDEAMQIDYARLHAISIDYSDAEDECTGFRDGWRSAEKYHGITKGGQHGD